MGKRQNFEHVFVSHSKLTRQKIVSTNVRVSLGKIILSHRYTATVADGDNAEKCVCHFLLFRYAGCVDTSPQELIKTKRYARIKSVYSLKKMLY